MHTKEDGAKSNIGKGPISCYIQLEELNSGSEQVQRVLYMVLEQS